jgi:hypothetical protein
MPCAAIAAALDLFLFFFNFGEKWDAIAPCVIGTLALSSAMCTSQPAGIGSGFLPPLHSSFLHFEVQPRGDLEPNSICQLAVLLLCAAQTLAESETGRAVATTARKISITQA